MDGWPPFRLDNLSHLPRYLKKGSYQTTLEDKSGYDHFLLHILSRKFFGIKWKGWFFVSNTIPFGWKFSFHGPPSFTFFVRLIRVPCSLYIDNRHNVELQFKNSGPTESFSTTRSDELRFAVAKVAVILAAYALTCLGYTLGLKKCVFTPQKRIKYRGFLPPSPHGFSDTFRLPWGLWAFRVQCS